MLKKSILTLVIFIFTITLVSFAYSAEVTLSWNESSGEISGYRIYYGTVPGDYSNNIDVGNVTQYVISGLQEGVKYYFVARAYNEAGESSDSNEVSWSYTTQDTEAPVVSITSPTNSGSYESAESSINLSGAASDNTEITQVLWTNTSAGGGGTASGKENWYVPSITLSDGENAITVTAYDADGNQGSANISVSYTPEPIDTSPPVGSIQINSGSEFTDSNELTLSLSATDSESGMGIGAQMKLSNDGINWTAPLPYSQVMNYSVSPEEGTKTVYAAFSDVAGNWMSSPVSDQIELILNQPPTATASSNLTSGEAPLSVAFNGSGSDSDGSIVSYVWEFGDGSTSTEQSPSHTYNTAGTYTAKLTVTDDIGDTAFSTVKIDVTAPAAPVAVEDIIIDNGKQGTSYTGRWRQSSSSGYYGTKSQFAQYGSATYTWTTDLLVSGSYAVYMRWTYQYWANSTVPVKISHKDGTSTVNVNQKEHSGEWVLLGKYNFGTNGTVSVTHSSGYRTTCVDAVKFVSD